MNTRHFLTCLALLVTVPLFAGDTTITHADAAKAAQLVKDKAVTVIDVRTGGEYKDGHIEGAKNIDFRSKDFETKLGELDKSKPYLVHCAAGGRSTSSLEVFKKLGFANIVHLDGGINAWEDAKQPLVK